VLKGMRLGLRLTTRLTLRGTSLAMRSASALVTGVTRAIRSLISRRAASRGLVMMDAGAIMNLVVETATAASTGLQTQGLRDLLRTIGGRQMATIDAVMWEAQMQYFQFAGQYERAAFERVARTIEIIPVQLPREFGMVQASKTFGVVDRDVFGTAASRGIDILSTDLRILRTMMERTWQNVPQIPRAVSYYIIGKTYWFEPLRYLTR